MEMTKKHIAIVLASAVAATLVFVLLFALPVSGTVGKVAVNTVSDTAYSETLVPYYLDKSSKTYMKGTKHYIDVSLEEHTVSDFAEVYVEVDMKKYTLVPFQSVWVGTKTIPDKYRDNIICVTNGPVMTPCETSSNKGNITMLVLRNGLSDGELTAMAKEIIYDVKWMLAMGIDGHVKV